ncbi:hypothetical protein AAF712_005091 [Marasmius tenuissimus]|uniref:Protein arginine methyltransferase NDUFAF7 n=1 Tax=Marasmius tenuissimus TaxID=585030 RepID=A0ABR3A1S8_9AGAR
MYLGIRRAVLSSLRTYRTTQRRFPTRVSAFKPNVNPRFYSAATPSSPVTPIEDLLLKNVQVTGPMSFATYMQFCLSHPTEGYYMKKSNAVFGPKGDFITSPDISQVFGELIAIWFLSQWQVAGAPSKIRLVELGPGRAALMADVLRVISQLTKPLKTEVEVHLVETSSSMCAIQEAKLGEQGWDIQWHDSLDSISPSSEAYTMLVAHEFFDALPFHVLKRTEEGWHEVLIASNTPTSPSEGETTTTAPSEPEAQAPSSESPTSTTASPRFNHVLTPAPTPISTVLGNSSPRFRSLPIDSFLEVSPVSFKIAYKIAELLSVRERNGAQGGCGLIIDYGGDTFFDNSRRAFKEHEIVDFFHRPGECDLTANVDFAYLREAMRALVPVYKPLSQGHFLQAMGLKERLFKLLEKNRGDPEKAKRIEEAALRLVSPSGMGSQYSVMGFSSNGGDVYPFPPDDVKEDVKTEV